MIAHLRSYLSASKKLLASILILGTLAVVFAIGLMFVAGYLISASADNAFSLLMLNIPLAFVQIFGLGKPIARYFERLLSHDWVLRLTSRLRHRLFLTIQAQERANVRWRTGDVLGSLASDIEHVQDLFLRTIFPVLIAWIVGVLLVCIAGAFSWILLGFAFGMMALLCLIVPLLALMIDRARIDRVNEAKACLYASVTDTVLGAQDVAIAGRTEDTSQHLLRDFERIYHDERMLSRYDRTRLLVVQALLLLLLAFILWWTTERFGGVLGGTSDWIVAVALGFFPLIEVIAPLSQQLEDGLSHRDSLQRLADREAQGVSSELQLATSCGKPPFDIALEKVSYHYADEPATLTEITLSIPYGQKVAILGRSGSGKTTLAHLIHGDIEPSEGSVKIACVPVGQLSSCIWDWVGLISQDSYIFAMSIMDNLRIGKIEVSETEAWEALSSVGLKDHVESLPDGLESMAYEAGFNFSEGQRQRLALARVLLQDPPIVILDEPTVGLDPMTEQKVLETIMRVFADKTVVMITHHLQGVDAFDRVLFVEEGDLVMDGAPAELARTNSRYRRLLAFDKGSFSGI